MNLWSRRTTWGGGPLPVEGSLVVIPQNVTVVLDVSPPEMAAVVVEGVLLFDEFATAPIELRVRKCWSCNCG